jgi:hypothetical protein
VIRVKVVRKHDSIDVYIYGLEKIYYVLRKHGFEQGDDEDGVLTWFWYADDVNVAKFIDELKQVIGAENVEVEYVEEQ